MAGNLQDEESHTVLAVEDLQYVSPLPSGNGGADCSLPPDSTSPLCTLSSPVHLSCSTAVGLISLWVFACLCLCLCFSLSLPVSLCLSVCQPACLPVCLSVCLSLPLLSISLSFSLSLSLSLSTNMAAGAELRV